MWVKRREHLKRRIRAIPPRFYAAVLLVCCLSAVLYGLDKVMRIVYVSDSDGAYRAITTCTDDTDTLLAAAGVTRGTQDRIRYTSYAGNVAALSVQRAFDVTVDADSAETPLQSATCTVKEALAKAGIQLGEYDYTEPSLHSELTPGDVITVHRVEYQDTVTVESIPYETVYSYTSEFYKTPRKTVVRQEGREGSQTVTSRERWVDGTMESSQVVSIDVTLKPRTCIIRAYQAGAPVSSRTGPDGTTNAPSGYKAVYTGRATGYYSSKGGRGASGKGLAYGTAAVNPSLFPYGSLLYIKSTDGKFVYGYAIATDTGGALLNGSALIDLYYETYEEAYANGVKEVNVYLVK